MQLHKLPNFVSQSEGAFASVHGDSLCLAVNRNEYGYQEFVFTAKDCPAADDYLVFKYSANGLMRNTDFRVPMLTALVEGEYLPLVDYQDIAVDGLPHTLIVACKYQNIEELRLAFVTKVLRADVTIHEMYFCGEEDLPEMLAEYALDSSQMEQQDVAASEVDFTKISLEKHFNHHYIPEDPDVLLEGGTFFKKEEFNVCGIPFRVKLEGDNVIYPAPGPAENDDIISNFGVMAKRRLCRPISRDNAVEIPVDMCASEIYFVLAANGLMYQRWSFGIPDPTILGGCRSELMMPLKITDVEFFQVDICYEDGRVDTAFPLSITKNRHVVSSETDAYMVPADGSRVRSIRVHNKKLETDLSVLALTINSGAERRFPQAVVPTVKADFACDKACLSAQLPGSEANTIARVGDVLTLKNGALSMSIDISHGLFLTDIHNAYTDQFSFKPGAMLRLLDEKKQEITEFELVNCEISSCAVLTYRYQALLLTATISFAGTDDIHFGLTCKNTGSEMVQYAIRYPYFEGGEFATEEDGWYFFPKCQNIDSNEYANLYGESAPTFPMQFFDLYSKAQQGGLAFQTYEREVTVRIYGVTKNEEGMTAFIEYPYMYGDIAAGASFTCSEASITAHAGDWKSAYALYKKWVDSWYVPHERAQNKPWYRKDFWLLAEIPDFFETKEFMDMPPWYDQEQKRIKFRDILEEHKSVTGCYPDILHMWGWTYEKELGHMKWGNWSDEDYEVYGGKEAFREALHDIQDNMGIDVSLYLHPTLLSSAYKERAEKFFPKHRVQRPNGSYIGRDSFRMCHANEEWRKEAISFYPKLYEDLQIPIMYVDEFSLRIENRCYAPHHGHHVPSNLVQTDREFISELRDNVPGEVVLYGEYTATDVNARYIDCNITYQYIDAVMTMIEVCDWRYENRDDTYSRVFTNAYRFVFPKIVQLNLPMAMRKLSWHPQKFIFFNGEAVYDSFWDNEESVGTAFNAKAFKIKKKYAHCFASDSPEMLVETPSEAICANKFPAENETIYTLYNRAYSTYRGPLLAVPHVEGQTYLDAWNDKEILPEIKDGIAYLQGQLDAQQMGCILVSSGK